MNPTYWMFGVFAALAFFMVRNNAVCKVRHAFIDDDALYPAFYKALPSYDDMFLEPQYWHLWTKSQWVKWLHEKGKVWP